MRTRVIGPLLMIGVLILAVAGSVFAEQASNTEPAGMKLSLDENSQASQPGKSAQAGEEIEFFPGQPKGFLTGMKGFDDFVHPVSSPLYFHDPFIDTRLNMVYLWHKFPRKSDLKGGDLHVWAIPFWVALSEKLQLTAEIDGYSRLRARALRPDEGWNDLAIGLKYNWIADVDNQFALSTGLSWRLSNGHSMTLNGGVDELNPYVTAAKAVGNWRLIGTFGGRLPMDEQDGNYILHENLHISYKLADGFFPLVEFNGIQYLSDGDRLPLDVGGLDFANIGSNNVEGNSTYWGAAGFRWKLHKHVELGAVYAFPLSTRKNDIFDQRAIVSVILGL